MTHTMRPDTLATYRVEKRVANTTHWGVVGYAATPREAAEAARSVPGGASTGVRICRTDDPYAEPIVIVGV